MLKDFVFLGQVFIELEYGRDVAATVTIVWGTPNRHNRLIEHQFVAFHCELVCSRDEVNAIVVHKSLGDVRPEQEARSTGRKTPAGYLIGIGP